MNKKGLSLPLERLGMLIFILVTMIVIIVGLALYVWPKLNQALPKLFG